MFKMLACAAFAAVPAFVAPAMAQEEEMTPAEEIVVAQVQVLADALEVLTSADSPVGMAEKMNSLTAQLGEIAEASKEVDADELKELEDEIGNDEDVQKLGETLMQVIEAHAGKGFHGCDDLRNAIEAFGEAMSTL